VSADVVWSRLSRSALEALAHGLESGGVTVPAPPSVLERYVGRELAPSVSAELGELHAQAFSPSQMSRLMLAVGSVGASSSRIELVWSGPESVQAASRDTGIVVPELFARAKRTVLVAGFAIRQGDRVFAQLAENMDANPALDVRIFTNIPRAWKEGRSDSELVRIFAEGFRGEQWSGKRLPKVLYDPRALSTARGPRSCLHAKCLIVDDQRTLITSANFTEAAMDRNIEVGVLIDDPGFSARLRAQFDALEISGQVKVVPGLT
jgi:PLD-like domain